MKAVLIDASGYMYRSFYTRPELPNADGVPVGAVYGYCEMLQKLLERERDCTHIAVVLDGGRSGRSNDDPEYKGNRKPRPPELLAQIDMLPDATASHSIVAVKIGKTDERDGMEADDIIGAYARQISDAGHRVTIYSSDKDLIHLIDLEGVSIYDPLKNQVITPEVCATKFGVTPAQMTDYLALVGDSSDNVPGVPSIGEKGAAKLLQDHYDLDSILALAQTNPALLSCTSRQRQSLCENGALAIKSRDLVKLRDVPDLPPIEHAKWRGLHYERLMAYLNEMGFAIMAQDIQEKFGIQV